MIDCTGCGATCCKNVSTIIEMFMQSDMSKHIKAKYNAFPYRFKSDGSCEKLVDGKCSVYDSRPTVCDCSKLFALMGGGKTEEEFARETTANCKQFKNMFDGKV